MKNLNYKTIKALMVIWLFLGVFALIKFSMSYTVYADNGLIGGLFEENTLKTETKATLNGTDYTFSEALDLAKSGDTVFLNNAVINAEVTVPEGVTLLIEKSDSGGNVVIERGGRLIVNGKLLLGRKEDIVSPYLESPPTVMCNGEIEVNGVMEGYLPIEGDGKITVNGEILEPLFIADYVLAAAEDCYKRGNLPFNQYFLNTLRITRIINHDGRYTGLMYGYGFSPVTLIADSGALFNLESGNIVLTYDKNKSLNKVGSINMEGVGKTRLKICGSVIFGVTDFVLDKSYSTLNTFVAIPYCMDIVVEKRFTVSKNTKLKVMPGAVVTVCQNATLNVDGMLSVYDGLYIGEAFGVTYPDHETLQKQGFSACGSLVVNGTLNVYGGFYGVVQSTNEGAVINVSKTATLLGTFTEGFITTDFSNLSVFTLKAKVFGLNDFITLSQGKTYKSARISLFSLKNVIMDKVVYGRLHTEYYDKIVELNQTLTGRFLEFAEGNFTTDATFNIGETVKNVCVNLNGKNYYTDKDGKFNAKVTLKDFTVIYSTPNKDDIMHSATVIYDGDTILDSVVKSLNLSEENDYVIKEGAQNNFYAVLHCYGGKTEKIEVFPKLDITEDYVTTANFTNPNYPIVSTIKHEVYFYKQIFDDYKNAYNGLIDQLSIKNSIQSVYETYLNLTQNRNDREMSFLNSVLKDFCDFGVAVDILQSSITYGDETAQVTVVFIDGTKSVQTVTLKNYAYMDGDITVNAEYHGAYKGISYCLEKVMKNVNPKKVTYIIDDKSGVYLDKIKPLTGRCLSGSVLDEGVITLYTTAGQNSPVGNYSIMGRCESPFYLVTFDNANYEIVKMSVSVRIYDKTITLSESKNIRFNLDNDRSSVKGFTVTDGENTVIIDLLGNLSQSLGVGVYTVKAIFDEDNFIVESNTATLTIIKDDKYLVDFGFNSGDSKVYDGNAFTFTVTAVNNLDPTIPQPFEVSIKKEGATATEILDAGDYVVCVKVGDSQLFANFTVTPCPINITATDIVIYYGDPMPQIEFTSSVPIDRSDIKFAVYGESITAESLNKNYVVKSVTGSVKTLPRHLTVRCDEKTKFYGDSDEALTCSLASGSLAANDSINKIVSLKREQGEEVGSYKITAEGVNDNYQVTVIPSNYVISPRNITVTANSITALYGEAFELSAIVTRGSLKAGDELSDIIRLYVAEGTAVGVYPVQAELKNNNYNLTFKGSMVEILPLSLTVTVPNIASVYGDNVVLTSSTLTKLPYGLGLKEIVLLEREEGNAVGNYKIYAESINDNFSVEFDFEYGDHSVLTVTKREITVDLSDLYAEFTDDFNKIMQNAEYTITTGNLIGGDSLDLEFSAEKEAKKVDNAVFGKPSAMGEYDLVIANCNPNYSVKASPSKLYVTKKRIWLKDIEKDFTYTGQPLTVFDVSENIGGLEGLDHSGFAVTIVDGSGTQKDSVINAGVYTVTVSADDSLFEFIDDLNAFTLIAHKADISKNIVVESDYGKFTVIDKNRPIARLLDYNCKLVTEFYYGEEAAIEPNKEGEYFVKVVVVDDNYKGEAVVTFTACKDVSLKIDEISNLLDEIKLDPSLKMTNLLKIKKSLSEFSEGENYQIDKISAYRSVIDEYLKVYNEFYEEEKQNFDNANGIYFGVNPVDLSLSFILLLLFAVIKKRVV